jgi:hypothetical protein
MLPCSSRRRVLPEGSRSTVVFGSVGLGVGVVRAGGVGVGRGVVGVVGVIVGVVGAVGLGVRAATVRARARRAGSIGTTTPASVSSVCGGATGTGSPMSPTGVIGGVEGGRFARIARSAPTARPNTAIETPPTTSCRVEGPRTKLCAASTVDMPESVGV